MDHLKKAQKELDLAMEEAEKLFDKGTKASSARSRKHAMNVKNHMMDYRKAAAEQKNKLDAKKK